VPLRVCLVSPFAWSLPHEVNEHVAGVADGLRALGHEVTVLAPSTRAADLAAGRRALQQGAQPAVIALCPSLPVARRTHMGVPVGVRANLTHALVNGRYDIVHGFEPGLPSLSYLALLAAESLSVATFISPDRLGYPTRRAQREKLLARVDALLATSTEAAAAARERFPGHYRVVSEGVDAPLFAPGRKRDLAVLEWRPGERPHVRAVERAIADREGWELVLLRAGPGSRPVVPRRLRDRVSVRTTRDAASRAAVLREASVFVPALEGSSRLRLEAAASGASIADARLEVAAAGAQPPEDFAEVAATLDEVYAGLARRRRRRSTPEDPLSHREWLACDLHMHTHWSHDCSIAVPELLDHAEAIGLGAIAVTDHNVFGGAREAVELARRRHLTVIPGEEVKTDDQGEVIGLFLSEEIPRGMSFGDTVAAIRDQGGLVYVPHPFDRMHAIPEPATLHRHLAEIDVFEVYNARLLFEGYNDEAVRFARKYNLTAGAGSDAHVLQGVGTGALRMRAFNGPEEFMLSLRTAEVLRRPKSLAYLQSLKWVAQVKEKVR
jgi:predicted metal-dependent phosphoesterase TrpH